MKLATPHSLPRELGATSSLNRSCSVCDCPEGATLGRLRYALLDTSPIADEYNVVCCANCGFVFCDTPSKQEAYDCFYEQYFYSPAYLAHKILPEEEQYFAELVNFVSSHLVGDRALFDIGCGTGNLLKACRRAGFSNVFGIDPSDSCINLLRQAGFQAAVGSTSSIPFPEIQPGVIVLSHIVEHILDMHVALHSIRERLTEDAAVYVEVPDSARYVDYANGSPLRFFYLQHLVHFDRTHLDNLFRAHGFRRIKGGHRVRVENELTMPAVWGMYERCEMDCGELEPNFDLALETKRWFAGNSLDPHGTFSRLAQSGNRVYVWGVGIHVQMMLGMSPLRDCNIVYCVDQDPKLHERTIHGRKIVPPSVLAEATESDTVVIGSLIHRQKMLKHLREEIGFRGEIAWV